MPTKQESQGGDERNHGIASRVSRRKIIKTVGASGLTLTGVGAMSGTVSAHELTFYGCSQVCTDHYGENINTFAVVYDEEDEELQCRGPFNESEYSSDRQDGGHGGNNRGNRPGDDDPDALCYEADDGEVVVGVIIMNKDGDVATDKHGELKIFTHGGGVDVRGSGRCAENYEQPTEGFTCE